MQELKTDYKILDDLIYRLAIRAESLDSTTCNSVQESDEIRKLLKQSSGAIWVLSKQVRELNIENYHAKHTVAVKDSYINYLQSRLDNAGVGYVK